MNRLVAVLVIAITLLVAAVAYLVGERKAAQPQNVAANPSAVTANTSASRPMAPTKAALSHPSQPVIIGLGGPNLDACGSNARVVGLNPHGDNFLAVKSAPRMDAPRIDKLGPDFEVYVCQKSKDGKWAGVVYEPDGQPSANCRVTGPADRPQPYSGRCQSGWVYSKYIDVYAG
jgi:hypothetical protein